MGAGQTPRIRPGSRRQIGLVNAGIARLLGHRHRRPPAAHLHHPRPPPGAVPALALVRRWADARGQAAAEGHRAGDPPRRPQHRLRVRVGPSRADRQARRARRRGDRPGPRRRRGAGLVGAAFDPAQRRRRASPGGRNRGRALGAAVGRARRGRADRALHAGRPLRDAGDDPEHAPRRARASRRAACEGPPRPALSDHRRRQRHRPGDGAGRLATRGGAPPDRHPAAGGGRRRDRARRAGGSGRRTSPTSPTTTRSSPSRRRSTASTAAWTW